MSFEGVIFCMIPKRMNFYRLSPTQQDRRFLSEVGAFLRAQGGGKRER